MSLARKLASRFAFLGAAAMGLASAEMHAMCKPERNEQRQLIPYAHFERVFVTSGYKDINGNGIIEYPQDYVNLNSKRFPTNGMIIMGIIRVGMPTCTPMRDQLVETCTGVPLLHRDINNGYTAMCKNSRATVTMFPEELCPGKYNYSVKDSSGQEVGRVRFEVYDDNGREFTSR